MINLLQIDFIGLWSPRICGTCDIKIITSVSKLIYILPTNNYNILKYYIFIINNLNIF